MGGGVLPVLGVERSFERAGELKAIHLPGPRHRGNKDAAVDFKRATRR